MDPSEHAQVAQATRGDEKALANLLERHGPAVRHGLAGRIPKRWRSVLSEDDVLQQTYVDAFRDIRRFEPRGAGSFVAWLRAIADRNLLDALKALGAVKRGGERRKMETPPGEDSYVALYDLVGTTTSTPSRKAARQEAVSVLTRALEGLPDDYRRVIEMYDLECRAIDAVAAQLKRSEGAVYMLRARAHRLLGEIMGTASKYLSSRP